MFKHFLSLLAVGVLLVPSVGEAQTLVGYDALGRLSCVLYPSAPPKLVTYTYDPAGNRTAKTITAPSGSPTCGSQTAGTPPTVPVTLTATNPLSTVASAGNTSWTMGQLGSASDGSTPALISASTSGGAGSCGSTSVTATTLTFTAPTVAGSGITMVCNIDYVFGHSSGYQQAGRIVVSVQGAAS
ncbi:RHS repeat domain-containing protein [Caulobacter sp. NIBR1757]|uniref:RHS repeat domain-containing protein n=1 Tax=Caulobacter sp. NIBR1757 TaxID=3016000 RepID=UPI0022F12AD7|nr:RHS repeat domain-containing protein [Caulobacter sp. NIBR1757]